MVEYVEYLAEKGIGIGVWTALIGWERNSQDAHLLVQARC